MRGRADQRIGAPYRSAGMRVEGPRALEPEDEMRLLLEAPVWPRGPQKVVPFGLALMAVAVVVVNLGSAKDALFASVYGVTVLLSPLVSLLLAQLKHRRRVAMLRAAGYDGESVTAQLRVADDPLVRVAVEPVTGIDDECALDERGSDASEAAGRR